MNIQIIEVISLIIKVAAIIAVYKLLKKMVDRIRDLEEEAEQLRDDLDNHLYKRHIDASEYYEIDRIAKDNKRYIKQLVQQLNKKFKRTEDSALECNVWSRLGTTLTPKYDIVDLTESEKTAKKLREQADELEEEQ